MKSTIQRYHCKAPFTVVIALTFTSQMSERSVTAINFSVNSCFCSCEETFIRRQAARIPSRWSTYGCLGPKSEASMSWLPCFNDVVLISARSIGENVTESLRIPCSGQKANYICP